MPDPLASTSDSESAYADAVTESEDREPTVAELENLVHELHAQVELLKVQCDMQAQVLSYRAKIIDNYRELSKSQKARLEIARVHYNELKAKYDRLDNLL